MIHITKTIHVEPGSELERVLDEAAETPVELEKSGVRYRLTRVDSESAPRRDRRADQAQDSIFNIIGIGASKEPTNIADHEQEYLADAVDPARRP